MADPMRTGGRAAAATTAAREEPPLYELIELLFFAYRDFVGDADRLLEAYGFGRAHHRVLHFVSRHPGLTIAALLDILKITKQSLGRVLKQLLDTGYIEQRPGPVDRRQRLLYPTESGRGLAVRLRNPQVKRIAAALAELTPAEREGARKFLHLMINPGERDKVAHMIDQ